MNSCTPAARASRGFTLIEMLVSLAITMVMMGSVVSLFGLISDNVSGSRAIIEMSERLRATRNRLQADLIGATATMTPPLRPENDEGYFEIIEGPIYDAQYLPTPLPPPPVPPTILGDADDVLMFTVRSRGEPFVGKYAPAPTLTAESQTAEVMYFCVQNGPVIDATTTPLTRLYTLYRRVLLVSPGLLNTGTFPASSAGYYESNDISVHVIANPSGTPPSILIPNSLGDLTKRENRFAHYGVFPFNLNLSPPPANVTGTPPGGQIPTQAAFLVPFHGASPRFADDILMTNVLAFDVQVYDPNAAVNVSTFAALTPTDPGYAPGGTVAGAYVNLGQAYPGPSGVSPLFNNSAIRSVTTGGTPVFIVPQFFNTAGMNTDPPTGGTATGAATYDTWSLNYENNGIDEDDGGSGAVDEGADGLDNGGSAGVVDDPDEMETRPPYPAPLRGLRVTIRAYEPSSRQVRQVVVVQDFLPE